MKIIMKIIMDIKDISFEFKVEDFIKSVMKEGGTLEVKDEGVLIIPTNYTKKTKGKEFYEYEVV